MINTLMVVTTMMKSPTWMNRTIAIRVTTKKHIQLPCPVVPQFRWTQIAATSYHQYRPRRQRQQLQNGVLVYGQKRQRKVILHLHCLTSNRKKFHAIQMKSMMNAIVPTIQAKMTIRTAMTIVSVLIAKIKPLMTKLIMIIVLVIMMN